MNRNKLLDIAAVQTELAGNGLNLCKEFNSADLAVSVPELELPGSCKHLLLIGSAGADLWNAMPSDYFNRTHPVDEYSIDCIESCLSNLVASDQWSILFPEVPGRHTEAVVPLQKLGALAGWHHSSPLGIGINGTHGLWFAYRAVVVLDSSVQTFESFVASESPCLTCETTPCLSHCPADALSFGQQPDLTACVTHRVADDSTCASTCLARLACPVGARFRYSEQQTAYFYKRSLASAERWIENKD